MKKSTKSKPASRKAPPQARKRKPTRRVSAALIAASPAAVSNEAAAPVLGERKSFVVYGPQGSGKSRHAAAIAAHFGLSNVIDGDWRPGDPYPITDTLILTNTDLAEFRTKNYTRRVLTLAEALQECGIQPAPPAETAPVAPWSASAPEILIAAADLIDAKAAARDKPSGERTMPRAIAAFNALTGHSLTEVEGWLFMTTLKTARATAGGYDADDFTDLAGYSGLAGEAAARAATSAKN